MSKIIVKPNQFAVQALQTCRVPVICAVHGYCIGGGVDLITACDNGCEVHNKRS